MTPDPDGKKVLDVSILPLRDIVVFPTAVRPLTISREGPLRVLAALGPEDQIAVFAQRDPTVEQPSLADLYPVGVRVQIVQIAELPDTAQKLVIARGLERVRALTELQREPIFRVRVEVLEEVVPRPDDADIGPIIESVHELGAQVISASPFLSNDLIEPLVRLDKPGPLADFAAAILPSLKIQVRQELLETLDQAKRLRRVHEELVREMESIRTRMRIKEAVERKVGKAQHEFFLREQLKAIRNELGESTEIERVLEDLRKRLDQAHLPDAVKTEADRELSRLEHLPADAAESGVVRTYLDWLASLPWGRLSGGEIDLVTAQRVLDEDHHDLEKVKERIVEFLAVLKLRRELKGPILCFVGPPGVGKTSLGKSIARASGRAFVRMSLGGMRDEAEIRGHRRTYVGALPGQIIQGIRRAGTSDPVFMLDEIDKLGADFRGDPGAALMEVLDPEQNASFRDHYLDVPFDLSKVLFITTANLLDSVPVALRDRMEVLELPGYSDGQKLAIAQRYIVPRQVRENGLVPGEQITFTDDALRTIVRNYTREAGVRGLERAVGAICRKHARVIASGGPPGGRALEVTPGILQDKLGAAPFLVEVELTDAVRPPGVALALAWTPLGGEVLFVEAARMPRDRGEVTLTGHMGEVMQESARIALSWVRANADKYGISPDAFTGSDVHVHVPSGAAPKDGPSAGIVLVAALVSAFTGRSVRPLVAMTGEITLSGRILPVGGIQEKVLAAKRSGVREIVFPQRNEPQVRELRDELREGLVFRFASSVEEGLAFAFPASTDAQPGALAERRALAVGGELPEAAPRAAHAGNG